MAFGALGNFGRLGRLGLLSGGGGSAVGTDILLGEETSGYAADYTFANTSRLVQVKEDGAKTYFTADAFLDNAGTSAKNVFNASGLLASVEAGSLAIDHDPITFAPNGLLVEKGSENDVTRSREFNNGAWVKVGGTVTADQIAGLGGALTGDQFVPTNGVNASGSFVQQVVGAAVAGTTLHTASWVVKRSDYTWHWAGFSDNSTQNRVWFNLATGVKGMQAAGISAATLTPLGNDRFLLTASRTIVSTSGLAMYAGVSDADNSVSCTGNGSNKVYFLDSQLEAGGVGTSLIPSVAANAARDADEVNFALSTIPWSATAGTVYFSARTPKAAATYVLWQADDGSEDDRIRIERNSSNEIHCLVTAGGVAQCDLNLGVVANDTDFEVTFAFELNAFAAALNGSTPETDGSGDMPTGLTTWRTGYSFTGEQWTSYVYKELYVPYDAFPLEP